MTYILSKKTKPKLVDNNLLNQITKHNLLKNQINYNCDKSKYKILLTTIHDKCINYLTNYFWLILFIIIIVYILWCRYKWYQKSLKNNNLNYLYNTNTNNLNYHYTNKLNKKYNIEQYDDKYNTDIIKNKNIINDDKYNTDVIKNKNIINDDKYNTDKKIYNDNIDTQYTNKKDNKYNNEIKPINFEIIDNTIYNNTLLENSNYSFL